MVDAEQQVGMAQGVLHFLRRGFLENARRLKIAGLATDLGEVADT